MRKYADKKAILLLKFAFTSDLEPKSWFHDKWQFSHMSNTLNQIPVDKTWSPTECSRKMKPEVQ